MEGNHANPLKIGASSCVYTGCYCEENIWKLCQFVEVNHKDLLDGCFAVFISNENRQIPIWMQRASSSPDEVVVWDYHVILICQWNQKSFVYDLDSTLQFPCSFDEYVQLALRSDAYLQRQLHRMFRVIPGQLYLETFASDRSHMKREDGSWQSTPPTYPCISTDDSSMNLDNFIQMSGESWHGDVLNLSEFTNRFTEVI